MYTKLEFIEQVKVHQLYDKAAAAYENILLRLQPERCCLLCKRAGGQPGAGPGYVFQRMRKKITLGVLSITAAKSSVDVSLVGLSTTSRQYSIRW